MAHNPSIMSIVKIKRPAIAIALAAMTYAQPIKADNFTGHDLLALSDSAQQSYISTSIVMASFVAGQFRQELSDCISAWYFEDPRGQKARHDEIMGVIRMVPQHHPSGTLVALMQRACGAFKDQ